MARKIKFKAGCLNLVAHPHSEEIYRKLFTDIHENRVAIPIGYKKKIILGSLHEHTIEGVGVLTGLFYRYFDISENTGWYNLDENSEATDVDLSNLRIPDNLRPDLSSHRFVFFPVGHKLFIQLKSEVSGDYISVIQILKYFEKLVKKDFIIDDYGDIAVTIIPHHSQVETMLSSSHITEISYEINLPNPDVEDEDSVVEWMQSQGVYNDSRKLKGNGGNLELSDDVKLLARTASSNGNFSIKEKTSEGIKVSTSNDTPLIDDVLHDPEVESATDTFWSQATRMFRSL